MKLAKILINYSLVNSNYSLDQSIGIDETNTFQLQFFYSKKIVGATGFGGLWDLRFGVPNFLLDQSKGIDETNSS